jgi:hypothetical protein
VQVDGQVFGELVEVGVRREDVHPVAHSDGANQQVNGRALDALARSSRATHLLVVPVRAESDFAGEFENAPPVAPLHELRPNRPGGARVLLGSLSVC